MKNSGTDEDDELDVIPKGNGTPFPQSSLASISAPHAHANSQIFPFASLTGKLEVFALPLHWLQACHLPSIVPGALKGPAGPDHAGCAIRW